MGSQDPPRVEVVASDLPSLEPTWRDLLGKDSAATVFQTWEWNLAWWRHFGQGRQLLVLVAHDSNGPLGLAPLALRRATSGLFRRVEFLGAGVSDYLGFVGPSGTMSLCRRAFLDFLLGQRRWDVLDLQHLSLEQAERSEFTGAGKLVPEGWPVRWAQQDVCPVLELPGRWEELLSRLSKKMRFNIGYYERLLRREHEVSLETADQDEVPAALEEFFTLHARRWRRRWQPGALYSRRLLQFHRDAARALSRAGYLALHRLHLDGQTAAALYCFHYGGRALYYLGGFEPALARFSPGTVLTAYAIRRALEDGCREFDFLRGREPYKYRWPVQDRPIYRLEVARRQSVRSLLALRWSAWQQRLENAARQALQGT